MVGLAGFVDAAAGGGGIISIPAYMFVGIPAHFALGCNKFSSTCGTTLTVFRFWKSGAKRAANERGAGRVCDHRDAQGRTRRDKGRG